jgi:hypothetical protein
MGTECGVHRHRELVPLERHHVWPKGLGGPDTKENIVQVCDNAHGSIHSLLDYYIDFGGEVPWKIRRNYGLGVRQLAKEGWDRIQAAGRTKE